MARQIFYRRSLMLLQLCLCLFSLTQLFGVTFYWRFQELSLTGKMKAHEYEAMNMSDTKFLQNMKPGNASNSENWTQGTSDVNIRLISNTIRNDESTSTKTVKVNMTGNLISNDTDDSYDMDTKNLGIPEIDRINTTLSNQTDLFDSNDTLMEMGELPLDYINKSNSDLIEYFDANVTARNDTDLFDSNDTEWATLLKMGVLPEMNTTLENGTLCPVIPPNLTGPIPSLLQFPSYEILRNLYPDLGLGGHWRPKDCHPRHRVAIIIPYRDRDSHLRAFLHNMHRLFQKQQLEYKIYVVEELTNQTFNRGKLMNVGFVEAMKEFDWQCFIFHDVDLLPEDDRNLYTCPVGNPRHMSVAVDKFQYQLPYEGIFGGVSALSTSMFRKVNGYSNDYWGWGAEDDDMAKRISKNGYNITRYSAKVARYRMMKHQGHKMNQANPCRFVLYHRTRTRFMEDGLNSLNYSVISMENNQLYTKITVDLMEDESRKKLATQIRCPVENSDGAKKNGTSFMASRWNGSQIEDLTINGHIHIRKMRRNTVVSIG